MSKEGTRSREQHALRESLYVGGSTGAIGAIIGSGIGTLRGRHAGVSAVAAGGNAFLIGTIFWYSRRSMLEMTRPGDLSSTREILYSAASGSIAGAAAGALVGRANIAPGALAIGVLGGIGQVGFKAIQRDPTLHQDTRPMLVRLSESKWWPLKSMSDAEYETLLRDKINVVEIEIAGVEAQIKELKMKLPNTDEGRS